MVSKKIAKKIGITHCAEAMGLEFVRKNAGHSSTGFSENDDSVFCFLGINDSESIIDKTQNLTLTNKEDAFPFRASCDVMLNNGEVRNFKYIHP